MIKAHLVKEYSVKYGSEFYISLDDFTSMLEKMEIDYFHNDESPFVEIVQHDLLNLAEDKLTKANENEREMLKDLIHIAKTSRYTQTDGYVRIDWF
ncbi:hypothetical protein T36_1762 [Helicobacter cinaedi]|uniref:hypothetical protein n=1 Tax=Helicobacter cinaedi TaxID=213 RepID=UPI001F241EB0|nr:hypothetical protein [Helicobacter cinaedi]BDB64110.1 hypothetical protein T36_0557 [Helicobacter cinaedi]BDB65286.1 hypothetical protein T36_1762 [Helicobacter cinaedi]